MNEEFTKAAKNFRMQMKWCAIMCWFATALLTYKVPDKIEDWSIITFGAIVFSIIYFKINKQIVDSENEL